MLLHEIKVDHEAEGLRWYADIAAALKKAEVTTVSDFLGASYLDDHIDVWFNTTNEGQLQAKLFMAAARKLPWVKHVAYTDDVTSKSGIENTSVAVRPTFDNIGPACKKLGHVLGQLSAACRQFRRDGIDQPIDSFTINEQAVKPRREWANDMARELLDALEDIGLDTTDEVRGLSMASGYKELSINLDPEADDVIDIAMKLAHRKLPFIDWVDEVVLDRNLDFPRIMLRLNKNLDQQIMGLFDGILEDVQGTITAHRAILQTPGSLRDIFIDNLHKMASGT